MCLSFEIFSEIKQLSFHLESPLQKNILISSWIIISNSLLFWGLAYSMKSLGKYLLKMVKKFIYYIKN